MASTVRQSMGFGEGASVSLTVGDLSKVVAGSGYLRALGEILKRFPNHFHLFAGPGDVKRIRGYLHNESVLSHVRFLGSTPDMLPLLDAADIYLACFPDSDANIIAQAIAAGKPVVALQPGAGGDDLDVDAACTESEYIDIASRLLRERGVVS